MGGRLILSRDKKCFQLLKERKKERKRERKKRLGD